MNDLKGASVVLCGATVVLAHRLVLNADPAGVDPESILVLLALAVMAACVTTMAFVRPSRPRQLDIPLMSSPAAMASKFRPPACVTADAVRAAPVSMRQQRPVHLYPARAALDRPAALPPAGRASARFFAAGASATELPPCVIQEVNAREIIDSRGNPTVEVDVVTSLGVHRAAVPSGASTGTYEALEMRDGDKSRYGGKGVLNAVQNVLTKLKPLVIGADPTDQASFDEMLLKADGTPSKSAIGANAILALSMAACKAAAAHAGVPLYRHIAKIIGRDGKLVMPVPCFNIINGGSHAGNKLAMQEFMILPTGAKSFREAMQMGTEVYHCLKSVIKGKYGQDAINVGDEGGFAPNILSNFEGLDLVVSAIEMAGYTGRVKIGMDVAASEFFTQDGKYDLDFKTSGDGKDTSQTISASALLDMYTTFVDKYPMVSIEDPFDENDWPAWATMKSSLGDRVQIVGDDLTVTNPARIATAVEESACNSLLLKVNQIGSLTEAIQASQDAKQAGWTTMVSHRSGETEDTFISDLVVGLSTGQIKTGAPCRGERTAKYNQLMRIEDELGDDAIYAGERFRDVL